MGHLEKDLPKASETSREGMLALRTVAVAYQRLGRNDDAIQAVQAAIEIAKELGLGDPRSLRRVLAVYQDGRNPFD